jgi:predicted ATPase/DNA-binding CsgD family transcriptional regulator
MTAVNKAYRLPAQPTSFVGREAELVEILRLLRDPACRLLTLVGPGGMGKTRLAIQAAARLAEDFDHAIAFVDLLPVDSQALVVSAIADALGLALSGREPPARQILSHLADRRLLLILDNAEHLLTPTAPDGRALELLSAMLAGAPGVKLLLTSREALNVQEEWRFPVRGLPFPESSLQPEAGAADTGDYAAVRLFVERARQVRPDFSLAGTSAGVARVCRLVEGMPLAIELAAAWVKTLPPAGIADEIQRSLDFLATHLRNVPERQRSLQAVFDQSWQLLSPAEQVLFRRLAVFRGEFDRRAAEAVAGASLDTLAALLDRGFLRQEPGGRYHMHALLWQYASEHLRASPGEFSRTRDRHAGYFAGFLHARDAAMNGGRQREATAEIADELANVRAAWDWAVDRGQAAHLAQAADALYLFYQFRGRYQEGVDAFNRAVDALDTHAPDGEALAEILVHLGWLSIRVGRLGQARRALERSRAVYAHLDSPPPPRGMASDPLIPLGVLATLQGDYAEAIRLGEAARQAAEVRDDRGNLMFAFYVLTSAHLAQGQPQLARQTAEQAYALALALDNRWVMAYCLNDLGHVACAMHDYPAARSYYQASYALKEEFEDPEGMAVALNHLGKVAHLEKHYVSARQLHQRSLALYREIGDRGGLATSLHGLGRAAIGLGEHTEARDCLRQALEIGLEIKLVPLILSIFLSSARLLCELDRLAERGVELLSAVMHHPASGPEAKVSARRYLNSYRDALAPASFAAACRRGADASQDLSALATGLQLQLATPLAPGPHPPSPRNSLVEPLTPRELEVLRLLAAGRSNREIAETLIVAVGTVKAHASNIYGKLGVANRVQAVTRAVELDLV